MSGNYDEIMHYIPHQLILQPLNQHKILFTSLHHKTPEDYSKYQKYSSVAITVKIGEIYLTHFLIDLFV